LSVLAPPKAVLPVVVGGSVGSRDGSGIVTEKLEAAVAADDDFDVFATAPPVAAAAAPTPGMEDAVARVLAAAAAADEAAGWATNGCRG
jgi:hypothetical protein